MSRRKKREKRSVAELSCGQMLLLFLLVVVLALAAALSLGYSLGVFDRITDPRIATTPSVTTSEAQGLTPVPIMTMSTDEPDVPSATENPQITAASIPAPTENSSTPVIATITPTTLATVPADVCTQLNLDYLGATSNVIAWRANNTSGQPFTLSQIEIAWPGSNDAIFNAFLDGNVIWSGVDQVSPTFITDWLGGRDERTMDSLSRLEFFFGTTAAAGGYELTLQFENGCSVSQSQ